MMKTTFVSVIAALSATAYASQGTLIDLGPIGHEAHATAISDDGAVVAGNFINAKGEWHVFRWTSKGGVQDLGMFDDGDGGGGAYVAGMSADGSVIVGNVGMPRQVFRWTQAGGAVRLGAMGGNEALACGVSRNGDVIFGRATGARSTIFRWKQNASLSNIDLPDGGNLPSQCDGDDSIAIEYDDHGHNSLARWSINTGWVKLGSPGEGVMVTGSDAAGEVIYGSFASAPSHRDMHMFKWTSSEGFVDLGGMGGKHAIGDRTSSNGNFLVGWQAAKRDGYDKASAFLWSSKTGAIDLGRLGGVRARASAVSSDGRVVAGDFEDKAGKIHAFILLR